MQIGASALLSGSVSDVLCDANRFFGLTAQSSVHTGIDANTGMLTARNNIFDANAAASVYAAVNAGLLSLDGSRVDLLNNTVFRLNGGGSVSLDGAVNLRLASSAVNNLVFAPGSHVPSIDLSGVVDLNGNLSAELDPFADSAGADLRLNLLSSAVGGGVSANVVIDVGAVLAVAATGNGGAGTGGSSNGGTSSGGTASGGSGSGGTSSGGSSSGGGTNSGGSSSGGGTNSGGNGTGGASTGGNGTGGTSGGGTGGGAGGNGPGFGPAMDGADVSADPAGIGVVGPGIEAESPSGEANAGTDLDAGFDPSQQSGCSAAPSRNSKPSSWLLVAAAAVVAMGRKRHP